MRHFPHVQRLFAICLGAGLLLASGCTSTENRYDVMARDVAATPRADAAAKASPGVRAPIARNTTTQSADAGRGAAASSRAKSSPAPVVFVQPAATKAPAAATPPPAAAKPETAAPAPALAVPDASQANPYVLNVDDVVQITLLGIPNPERIEVVIYSDGMVSLPLIKPIRAVGLTAAELEQAIRKQYMDEQVYRDLTVNVVVPARFYFMQGEIRQPGRYQLIKAMRVSQAIAGAGGYTEFASRKGVVKRKGQIYKVIRNTRRLEQTPEDDILIEPDDIIIIERSFF